MAETTNPTKPAAKHAGTTSAEMAHAEKVLAGSEKKEASAGAAKGHGEKSGGGKKKKGGKGKEGPSLTDRIKHGMHWTRVQLVELFKSLISPDGPTRRMSLFFFISLLGVGLLGVLTVQRKMRLDQERLAARCCQRGGRGPQQ